jgi:phosphoribosylformimino-5-aminoimidazole carboxamide ribotide isomerase
LDATAGMVEAVSAGVIASGGVSSAADLAKLDHIKGLSGAIIGRALFDGLIRGNLREAMQEAGSTLA